MRFQYHRGFECWALHRHADVLAAFKDSQRFATSLVANFDEVGHTRVLRQAMEQAFPPTRLAAWRCELEALHVEFSTEIVKGFAEPWSHAAALLLVGLPVKSGPLQDLTRTVFAAGASPFNSALSGPAEAATQDLLRILPNALGPLTMQAFVATSQTLAAFLANAALALLENHARADTARAIEELLRYAGPSQAQFRYSVEDIRTDNGEWIPRRSRIALLLAEANRDPEMFADPNRLDLERNASGHLAFGAGPHACIGALLIRTAVTVALEQFSNVYAGVEIESVEWPEDGRAIRSPLAIRIREHAPATM